MAQATLGEALAAGAKKQEESEGELGACRQEAADLLEDKRTLMEALAALRSDMTEQLNQERPPAYISI
jgi:hypothetical protein